MQLWNYGNVIEFLESENEVKIEIDNFDNNKTDKLIDEIQQHTKIKKVKQLTIKDNLFKLTLN